MMLKLRPFFPFIWTQLVYDQIRNVTQGDILMTIYSKLKLIGVILLAGSSAWSASAAPVTCSFNGQVIANEGRVVAYQNSTVPEGQSCVSEIRSCVDGVLYGSFAYATCSVTPNASCLFNGQTIPHGGSVTAYTSSTVAFGQSCTSVTEVRTCNNGVLSGSASYSSCNANSPRACLFNGETLAHGESVKAFESSTTQFGGSCISEIRSCQDGTLSGSFQFGACNIDQPASCLFDGRTLAHGETVAAFPVSSVGFGQTCTPETRSCFNGVLSGTNPFASCTVNQPASCSFDGRTLLSGESVTAFLSSSVAFGSVCQSEARSCLNGQLSGSFTSSTCQVESPATCSFNGQIINHAESVIAYASSQVSFGGSCQSEVRSCQNGQLSGSFNQPACRVTPAADCTINGDIVKHGSTATLYVSSSVPYGQKCQSEQRTCNNGLLSGSATQASCQVENAPPAKNCILNGQTIASGSSVLTYQSSSVPFGKNCVSESRLCMDGVLSGSFSQESCSVLPAATCRFDGKIVDHGASVLAFKNSSSGSSNQKCESEQRTCNNGVLSGSFVFSNCSVPQPQSCTLNGKTIASGSSITVFTQSSVPYGQVCQVEKRQCLDGVLSGSATHESCLVLPKPPAQSCDISKIIWEFSAETAHNSCGRMIFGSFKSRVSRDSGKTWVNVDHKNLPEDLKEIFRYITKKQKIDGIKRPANFMIDSKNKGYLVIRPEFIPPCDVCKYVEVSGSTHSCGRRQAPAKAIKFVCEDKTNTRSFYNLFKHHED